MTTTQWSVFSHRQAREAGLTKRMIGWRVARGDWLVVHPGVYRLAGASPTWEQRLTAACLAAGPAAVVSHSAAAALWTVDGFEPRLIEVTVLGPERVVAGAVVRRTRRLSTADVTRCRGIPVTDVARTLIDLAGCVGQEDLEAALDWALREHHLTIEYLARRLDGAGSRGRAGAGRLKALMDDRHRQGPFESRRERRFSEMLVAAGLPVPVRQYELRDKGTLVARFDLARPEARLAIEFQSYRHHFGRRAWRHDVGRGNAAAALDWLVFLVTEDDVNDESRTACHRIVEVYHRRLGDESMANRTPAAVDGLEERLEQDTHRGQRARRYGSVGPNWVGGRSDGEIEIQDDGGRPRAWRR